MGGLCRKGLLTIEPRSWVNGPRQGFGGDLDHSLEMQRQPHSVSWPYAIITIVCGHHHWPLVASSCDSQVLVHLQDCPLWC